MMNMNILDLSKQSNLEEKFLISSPAAKPNEFFDKSVIYIINHDKSGAVGLAINHTVNVDKNILGKAFIANTRKNAKSLDGNFEVFLGGPNQTERGFIIHSDEYDKDFLLKSKGLAISVSQSTLSDILKGKGPEKSMLVIGYTKWAKNELEKEIADNLWIVSDSDTDVMFSPDNKNKWRYALNNLGINENMFCGQVGRG